MSQAVRIEDEPAIADAAVDLLILDASCVVTEGLFTPRARWWNRSGAQINASNHLIRGEPWHRSGEDDARRLNTRQYREPESPGAF